MLRSFSRLRVLIDNPHSESLFRRVKYRPCCSSWLFTSKDEAYEWVASSLEWSNHQHRHSGIKFVTPQQRLSGPAVDICRQRANVYEKPIKKTSVAMELMQSLLASARGGGDQQSTRSADDKSSGTIGSGGLKGRPVVTKLLKVAAGRAQQLCLLLKREAAPRSGDVCH